MNDGMCITDGNDIHLGTIKFNLDLRWAGGLTKMPRSYGMLINVVFTDGVALATLSSSSSSSPSSMPIVPAFLRECRKGDGLATFTITLIGQKRKNWYKPASKISVSFKTPD